MRVPDRFDCSLAMRNGDRALRPRSERSSAIDATVDVKDDYTPQGHGGESRLRMIDGASLQNENQVRIALEFAVDGQQMRGLSHRLGDKQTVERITMMYG